MSYAKHTYCKVLYVRSLLTGLFLKVKSYKTDRCFALIISQGMHRRSGSLICVLPLHCRVCSGGSFDAKGIRRNAIRP